MEKYIVRGGGWYVGIYNTRTKRYSWKNKNDLDELKRTEAYLLTKEQADGLIYKNSVSFMKMAGVTMEKVNGEE